MGWGARVVRDQTEAKCGFWGNITVFFKKTALQCLPFQNGFSLPQRSTHFHCETFQQPLLRQPVRIQGGLPIVSTLPSITSGSQQGLGTVIKQTHEGSSTSTTYRGQSHFLSYIWHLTCDCKTFHFFAKSVLFLFKLMNNSFQVWFQKELII